MEISPSYNLVIPPLPIYILLSVSSPACTVLLSLKPTMKTVVPSGGHGRPLQQLFLGQSCPNDSGGCVL